MKGVDTYIPIQKEDIVSILTSKDISKIQGRNIAVQLGTYDKGEMIAFFDMVINQVNKIALEKEMNKYFLVAKQVDENLEEPFEYCIDLHDHVLRNGASITEFLFDDK